MKVFVSKNCENGYKSPTDFNWCEPNEILVFSLTCLGNGNPSEVYMTGTQSLTGTTHITVADLDIDREFLFEIFKGKLESGGIEVADDGSYSLGFDNGFDVKGQVWEYVDELIEKVEPFEVGETVIVRGRTLYHQGDPLPW
jgi:hypothetical protein